MPRINTYIQKHNWDKWQTIPQGCKAQFINSALNRTSKKKLAELPPIERVSSE